MTKKHKATDDYEVGYGKPPKHSRFKSGKSGNPKGRPKGNKNLRSIVRDTLFKTVKVTEDGQVRTMNRVEAIVTGLVAKGLKGDIRASESVLRLANQNFPPSGEIEQKIYLQRFTDGEVLGEYVPQPNGQRGFVPSSKKTRGAPQAEKGATKSSDEDDSNDKAQ
jgi:Family of unknown function (DUF5681)